MQQYHSRKSLRVELLGIALDEHFQLDKHTSKLLKDCYSSLAMLKKLKQYTPLAVRKQLIKSLMCSRLDYCNNLFIDLPQRQIKRLLKLQKACAGFVLNKYATCANITKLKWLLVPEKITRLTTDRIVDTLQTRLLQQFIY